MSTNLPANVEIIDLPAVRDEYVPAVGDYVAIREDFRRPRSAIDSKVWIVRAIPSGRSKYTLLDDPEGGRGMKVDGWSLRKATDEEAAKAAATVPTERFHVGSVVRIDGPGIKAAGVWVVLGDSTKGGVKAAPLGGSDRGTYYPHVPLAYLTRVDAASIIVP
jgi:hypothetical protein